MKKSKKQVFWRFIRLFRLDIPGFFVGVLSLWDVIVLGLVFISVAYRFGASFKGAGIMVIISAVLLFNARRLWTHTRMRDVKQSLSLTVSARLIATLLCCVVSGLVLVNAVFNVL